MSRRLWLVVAAVLGPLAPANSEPTPSDDRVRVLVWNAWRGGNEVDRGPEKVLRVIREVDPDLVLMQESYDVDGDRPTLGRWIASELGWHAHQGESTHLCVISRRPLESRFFHDPWHGVGARIEDPQGRAFVAWSIWLDYRAYLTYALRDDPSLTDEQLLALETDASARFDEVTALLGDVDEVSALDPAIPTLVGGDFNCPSHLDWTRDTARMYRHRRDLDLPVSNAMYAQGFVDVFREVHPDPIQRPGITWSPMFREKADGTVQAFDRIDRLYLRNPEVGPWTLVPVGARTLPEGWEDDRIPVRRRHFPSDHGAVVLDLEWQRAERRSSDLRIESVERIAAEAPHSAFTDLLQVGTSLYCAFREGDAHVHGADGRIRILRRDGEGPWRSVALLSEPDVDLRDPKLSRMPDGRLLMVCGGSDYDGEILRSARSRVAFSDADREDFGPLIPVSIDPDIRSELDWLWRITWDDSGVAWGTVYQASEASTPVRLVSSADGVEWRHVVDLPIDGRANEATLRFDEGGRMTALVRREGDDPRAVLGVASAPYLDWTFDPLPESIGGPNLVRSPLGDGWLVAGRRRDAEGARTVVWWRGDEGGWETMAVLPSGGDTSYPGLVLDDHRLLVSYYSSHEGRTAIHLADTSLWPRDDGGSMVPDGRRIRHADEVFELIEGSVENPRAYGGTLLVGSSILRLWSSAEERLAPHRVVNHGFGGARTWELLEFAPRLVAAFRPRTIVVYCGSNDVNADEPAERIVERLRRFTDRMEEQIPGVRIVHVSIDRAPEKSERWSVVDRANRGIEAVCAAGPNRFYLDLNPDFLDRSGSVRTELYLPDGLHLAPETYAGILEPRLDELLTSIDSGGRSPGDR